LEDIEIMYFYFDMSVNFTVNIFDLDGTSKSLA
jgi:hypothetical protein